MCAVHSSALQTLASGCIDSDDDAGFAVPVLMS